MESPEPITQSYIDKFCRTMVRVLDTRNKMPDEDNYAQQEFYIEEGQIKSNGRSPIPHANLTGNKEDDANLAQAI